MQKSNKNNDMITPYVTAVIHTSRISEEKIIASENIATKANTSNLRTYSKTASTFGLGLPEEGEITSFKIELVYSVTIHLSEDHADLFKYESKSEAIFQIKSKDGFDNWEKLPDEALAPYFSFVHFQARQRAAEHLLAAGIRGIILPAPDSIQAVPSENPAIAMQEKPSAAPATRPRQPKTRTPKAN